MPAESLSASEDEAELGQGIDQSDSDSSALITVLPLELRKLINSFNAHRAPAVINPSRALGNYVILPFVKTIGRMISFCKDTETIEYEMSSLNSLDRKCKKANNTRKPTKTTETLLE